MRVCVFDICDEFGTSHGMFTLFVWENITLYVLSLWNVYFGRHCLNIDDGLADVVCNAK